VCDGPAAAGRAYGLGAANGRVAPRSVIRVSRSSDAPLSRAFVRQSKIDPEQQISYLRTMIDAPTFVSTMMMPLSFSEAEPFGM
jgi:hypothetical protein